MQQFCNDLVYVTRKSNMNTIVLWSPFVMELWSLDFCYGIMIMVDLISLMK